MRLDPPVAVLAATTELPTTRVLADDAVASGAISRADADAAGVVALPVEPTRAAPELAVDAARRALREARRSPADVDLVVHAWTHYQGHDFWSPTHYLADTLGAHHAECLGVQQMCHGGVAALQVAATRIATDPGVALALVTTADRFDDAWFDRWSGDYGVLYGDGGTACVLARAADAVDPRALVHGVVGASLPGLESMHRRVGGFGARPDADRPIDVRATKKAYLERHGSTALQDGFGRALRSVVPRVLEETGTKPDEVDAVVLPRVGAGVVADLYAPVLAEILPARTVHDVATTGHLGAGDLAAGIADADRESGHDRRLRLYVTAGAGFTVSACLVEHLPAREELS